MNVIIGQAHFIKTVEDLHEALAGVSPHLRFGVAFCEASSARLVRRSGNDDELTRRAAANALAIGAGHSFVILLTEGFPINVLNPLKAVPEVCTIFCATANPVDVLVAATHRGRGTGRRRPESSRTPTSPTGAACCAPSATSSDNRRRPGRHADALSDPRVADVPDEGCLLHIRASRSR
jgi:adenosine/AMP kinase